MSAPWLRALHTHWRAEPTMLLIVGLTAAALLGFAQVVDAVIEGEARAVDERVLRALRSPADPADPIGPWWVEVVFRDVTALGGAPVLTLVTLGTLGYLLIEVRRPAYLLSVAVLLTLLVGVSRVYLGVHWPTDVVAGWCVGAAWAMVCWLAALWVARRSHLSPAEQSAEQAVEQSTEG